MRERDIESYLVKRVKAMGGEVRKVKWIGRRAAPDRLVMLPHIPNQRGAWFFYAELKTPGEKPTAAQLREHQRMQSFGMVVFVIDSLELVDAVLA